MERKIAVLCGSDSDLNQIASGLALLRLAEAQGSVGIQSVEVCSAHRNPKQLRQLLRKLAATEVDVVIMCAGKLAALFGDCDAISRNELHNRHTHFIAVPLNGTDAEASQAAYLSAKQVPNSQFIFREEFFGDPEEAFAFAINGELPEITRKIQKHPQSLSLEEAYHKGRRKYQENASYDSIIWQLESGGLIHMYTGKTRETFINPEYPDLLYILATDRISIFDIVMNTTIPGKGAVLTAMTVHWLTNVFPNVPNHLVAYGGGILKYLPPTISESPILLVKNLMKNMIVVKRTKVLKVEAIVRGYLTGSGFKDYQNTGKVCGIELCSGMIDGSEIHNPIFTPSTKADYGLHDENISFEKAVEIIGKEAAEFVRDTALYLYLSAKKNMLLAGIIVADTKFEFGIDSRGNIILIDEVLTPDSSRFWPKEGWYNAVLEGKTPPSFDKQPIRIAGEAGGIKTTNTEWVPSNKLIAETAANYRRMIELATGISLEQFWREEMGVF